MTNTGTNTGTKRAAAMPAEERRAAILAAVQPLLIEHGDRVTSRQIADAAGVAEGTLFRVFADKDELITAAIDAMLDPAPFEAAVGAIDADLELAERLVVIVELLQRRVADVWKVVSGSGSVEPRVRRPLSVSPALVELFDAERAHLRVEPEAAATMLRALTLSLTHPMLVADPASARDIVDVVMHGIVAADGGERR